MATIWARRRPIRDGATYSNEPNLRISPIPSRAAEERFRRQWSQLKMIATDKFVEGAQIIATHSSSGGGGRVNLLTRSIRKPPKFSMRVSGRDARKQPYAGANP